MLSYKIQIKKESEVKIDISFKSCWFNQYATEPAISSDFRAF